MKTVRSDVEENAIKNENKLLNYYTDKANYDQEQAETGKRIVHLSLLEIAQNISTTIIAIINELVDPTVKKDTNGLLEIFFKGDRMIYIGITALLVALGLYFIDISS